MIEPLESRRLWRASVLHQQIGLSRRGDTLIISGSVRDDVIHASQKRGRLRLSLNDWDVTVPWRFKAVAIYGGRGDDTIRYGGKNGVADAEAVAVAAYIDGGSGNDTVQSGVRADTLLGGSGDDVLRGVFGRDNDYQDGGPGDDRLFGGATAYGGDGYDVAETGDAGLPISGGVEKLTSRDGGAVIPRTDWAGELTDDGGRLVFLLKTYAHYRTTLTGPLVRADGTLVLRQRSVYLGDDDTTVPYDGVLIKTFDTAVVTRRGLALTRAKNPAGDAADRTIVARPSAF